jgi:DNA-binding transcriptional regulator YdaS (Cro superfamily)
MKILDAYLKEKTGRATELAQALAVSKSYLSQARKDRRRIPVDWMPVIEDFTNGVITVEALVAEQARGVVVERRKRRKQNGSVA